MWPWYLQALTALFAGVFPAPFEAMQAASPPAVPGAEMLAYRVEWRLIRAGNASLRWSPSKSNGQEGWAAQLHLESAGLVSRLFKVNNDYSSLANGHLCVVSSLLKANEGNRRRETSVVFDAAKRKAFYTERDLVKNSSQSQEADMRACEHDVIGALYQLRTLHLEPGKSAEIPVTDGKKAVMAKVEAQEREVVKTEAGTYKTLRYEAFLFNDVLYRRRGRLFVWLTDDQRKLPVQVRIRLPFYVGTITLQLEKEGKI